MRLPNLKMWSSNLCSCVTADNQHGDVSKAQQHLAAEALKDAVLDLVQPRLQARRLGAPGVDRAPQLDGRRLAPRRLCFQRRRLVRQLAQLGLRACKTCPQLGLGFLHACLFAMYPCIAGAFFLTDACTQIFSLQLAVLSPFTGNAVFLTAL